MVQTIAAADITLGYLEEKFGLKLARDDQFFTEWLEDLPEITTNQKQFLDEVKEEYFHLIKRRRMLEDLVRETPPFGFAVAYGGKPSCSAVSPYNDGASSDFVKMVVLSPLLKVAGFYRPPFEIETEAQVQISAEDEGEVVRGRIDVLILQGKFWIIVIEAKKQQFSLDAAIPQALAYMLSNPNADKSTFGLLTNGSNFIFVKVAKQDTWQYAFSDVFWILNRGNDLYSVVSVLKHLGGLSIK